MAVPPTLMDRCRAYLAVTPDGIISHATAAVLHGLWLPWRFEELPCIDVTRPRKENEARRRGITGHAMRLEPWEVTTVAGIAVTTVERTLLDIAPQLGIDELVVLADQIVSEHHRSFGRDVYPRVELGQLRDYLTRHAGARGMKRLRLAMELARVGSDSPPETNLRLLIMRSPLPNFDHNVEIKDVDGNGKVGPDLACEEYKTCAEYDGLHHFTAAQQSSDHDRDFVTRSLGWHQVLINKDDMRAGEIVVITKIARMLVAGGWDDPQNLATRSNKGWLNSRTDFG
ncbi:hypothetical protein ACX80D_16670 [Arthrobacter sp. Sr24]